MIFLCVLQKAIKHISSKIDIICKLCFISALLFLFAYIKTTTKYISRMLPNHKCNNKNEQTLQKCIKNQQ